MSLLILTAEDLISGDCPDWILEGRDDVTYDQGFALIRSIQQGFRQAKEMVALFPQREARLAEQHNAATKILAEELGKLLDLSSCNTCGKIFTQPWHDKPFLYCEFYYHEMKEEEVLPGAV